MLDVVLYAHAPRGLLVCRERRFASLSMGMGGGA
jgi:hypothetical protein